MPRATNISQVFSDLDTDTLVEVIDRPHRLIRDGYRVPVYAVGSYEEACEILTEYYQYHFEGWLRSGTPLRADIAFANVRMILDGHEGGWVVAVKNAIRGRRGGLIGLIDAIAEAFQKEALEKYVRYVIDTRICLLDFEQVIAFAEQYLDQYGRYLLPGEELMSKYELAANLEAIIQYHVQIMDNFRQRIQ